MGEETDSAVSLVDNTQADQWGVNYFKEDEFYGSPAVQVPSPLFRQPAIQELVVEPVINVTNLPKVVASRRSKGKKKKAPQFRDSGLGLLRPAGAGS